MNITGDPHLEFNAGSDARIAGDEFDNGRSVHWQAGWLHVHRHWGVLATWSVERVREPRPGVRAEAVA